MLESKVIKDFKTLIKSWVPDAVVTKISQGPFSQKGLPDLLFLAFGKTALIEVKKDSSAKLTDLQVGMLTVMAIAGGPVGLLTGTDKAGRFELVDWQTKRIFVIDRREGKDAVVEVLQEFLNGPKPKKEADQLNERRPGPNDSNSV